MIYSEQYNWKDAAKEVFQDSLIAESFISLADSWIGSRGQPFKNYENDKLAHINAYLNKHRNGEYITELSSKRPTRHSYGGFVLAKHVLQSMSWESTIC